jgi:radical SAM-linked protein
MQRLRITYTKLAALRYTSNLDVHKIWERSLRRAGLPLAYSQGFHPQPKLNQACPLPLGLTSHAEMIDIWLETEFAPEDVLNILRPALPPGLELQSILPIELLAPSLPPQVISSDYVAVLLDPVDGLELRQKVDALISAEELLRERRGKPYNLRPLVEQIDLLPPDDQGHSRLSMRLSSREGATGRVEEVMLALGYDPYDVRVDRVKLNLSEPITASPS